jgi:hypothetical protein
MLPRIAPRERPAKISRRMTRHQSRTPTSPRASAQMTRVAACDPELPPLEMMSGTNSARTTAFEISSSNAPISDEEGRQPSRTLLNHAPEGDADVRLVEGFRAADALDFPGRGRLGDIQHIVDRHDADQHASGVGDGQCGAIVLTEDGHRGLLIVGGFERHEAPIHQIRDTALERRQEKLADADVVDQ